MFSAMAHAGLAVLLGTRPGTLSEPPRLPAPAFGQAAMLWAAEAQQRHDMVAARYAWRTVTRQQPRLPQAAETERQLALHPLPTPSSALYLKRVAALVRHCDKAHAQSATLVLESRRDQNGQRNTSVRHRKPAFDAVDDNYAACIEQIADHFLSDTPGISVVIAVQPR